MPNTSMIELEIDDRIQRLSDNKHGKLIGIALTPASVIRSELCAMLKVRFDDGTTCVATADKFGRSHEHGVYYKDFYPSVWLCDNKKQVVTIKDVGEVELPTTEEREPLIDEHTYDNVEAK